MKQVVNPPIIHVKETLNIESIYMLLKDLLTKAFISPLLILCLTLTLPAKAQDHLIEDIRFSGNLKTQPRIMLQEISLRIGEPFSSSTIKKSKQAIMDLGLFSSVSSKIYPGKSGTIIEFIVIEKYYLIPLPTLERTADGEIKYGGNLRVDNIAGLNQTVKFNYEAQQSCCNDKRTIHSLDGSYYYPRLMGSYYGLRLSAGQSQTPLITYDTEGNEYAEHKLFYNRFRLGLTRWLTRDEGPSLGWHAGISSFWQRQSFAQESGPALSYDNATAVGLTGIMGYTRVHNHIYSRSGMQYGLISEQGLVFMGSDSRYTRHQFYYRNYIPLGPISKHINLNIQTRFGISSGQIPVSNYAYTLGGSDDLRGYDKNDIRGQSYFVQNIELLVPLFGHLPARGLLFTDFGNAYKNNRMIDADDIESSFGLGIRYKFKTFVNLQLRADISYATGPERPKFYVGSKSTF